MNRIPPVMFFMTFAKRNSLCIQCNAIRAGKTYQESVEVLREQKFAQAGEGRRRFVIIRNAWISLRHRQAARACREATGRLSAQRHGTAADRTLRRAASLLSRADRAIAVSSAVPHRLIRPAL